MWLVRSMQPALPRRGAAMDEKPAASKVSVVVKGWIEIDTDPRRWRNGPKVGNSASCHPFVRPNPVNPLWDRALPETRYRAAVIEAAVHRPAGYRRVAVGLAATAHAQLRTFEEQPQLAAVWERRVVSFAAVIAHVSSYPSSPPVRTCAAPGSSPHRLADVAHSNRAVIKLSSP